jgi:glycosyltransferase involved in cell wall biosynthesis
VKLARPSRLDPTPGGFVSLARRAARWLEPERVRAERFDLVHFTDAREAFLLPESPAFPVIGTVHDDYALAAPRSLRALRRVCGDPIRRGLYYAFLRRVEPAAYSRLSRLVVASDHVRRSIALGYGVPRHRISVVPIGVEPPPGDLSPAALPGEPAILFVGANFYRKGLPSLLLAAAMLRSRLPGVRVHVVGEDRNAARVRAAARASGVPDGVATFHGRKAPAEVRAMMAAALCTALPSRTEALGLVLLESMSVGTPVIASASGGSSEIVDHGENGFLVPPADPRALAAAVERIAGDAALRRRMAERGRDRAAEMTPDRTAAETAAVYREVASGRAGSSPAPAPTLSV